MSTNMQTDFQRPLFKALFIDAGIEHLSRLSFAVSIDVTPVLLRHEAAKLRAKAGLR